MADNCPFEITPFAKPKPTARLPFRNFSYTNQDYWSLKSRIIDLIKQSFDKDFNNFMESDLAIMLSEIWAFIGDTLSFKIDQIANEVFIDSVREPENAFRLARLVGYKPTPPIPARALFMATISGPIDTDIMLGTPIPLEIPGGGKIELYAADSNNNPIPGEAIIIPAGSTSTRSIIGIEGFTHTAKFRSNGEANQVFDLKSTGILWKSIQVFVNGAPWTEVEYFTASQPQQEYRLEYTANYQAYIVFGDNQGGLIPSNSSSISVVYRVGGGSIGNIVTGAIKAKTNYPVQGFDHVVSITYTNYSKGEFGYSGDTIEDIRKKLPSYIRTQHRAVTGLDYKTIAEEFATPYNGVIGKSAVALRNYGCAGNIIDVYVLARDGDFHLVIANDSLKASLQEELDNVKMFTDMVCIKDAKVTYADIQIDCITNQNFKKYEVQIREKLRRRLEWFFRLSNWEFGQTLREADIVKTLADIKEVERLEITFTTTSMLQDGKGDNVITANFNEIIRPDTIEIKFNYQ